MTTYRQEKDGAYEIAYFGNTTFDVCEAIESHMSRIFVALYLPDLWNMGNVMESCPRTVNEPILPPSCNDISERVFH